MKGDRDEQKSSLSTNYTQRHKSGTSEMTSVKAPDERGLRRTGMYVEGLARRATQDDGIYDVPYINNE